MIFHKVLFKIGQIDVSLFTKWLKVSKYAETSILFRNRQENFGLGFKNLEMDCKCFQIVKWYRYILKYSLDGQMQALYLHKLKQEKEGKLGKGRKADRAPCLAVRDLKLLLSSMNALDKAKPQGKELGGITTNQSHFPKCPTSNNVAN